MYVFLQYFDTVGWVFWPVKTVALITYTVLEETLNPAQSTTLVLIFMFKLITVATKYDWIRHVGGTNITWYHVFCGKVVNWPWRDHSPRAKRSQEFYQIKFILTQVTCYYRELCPHPDGITMVTPLSWSPCNSLMNADSRQCWKLFVCLLAATLTSVKPLLQWRVLLYNENI